MNSFFLPMPPTPCPSPQGPVAQWRREAGMKGVAGHRAMLFSIAAILAAVAPISLSLAADRQLTGPEIAALLPRIVAFGDDDRQVFAANGETIYSKAGEDRIGRWEVRGDRYCSLFAPAKDWTCRVVHAEGADAALPARLTWSGGDGRPLTKLVRKKEAQP